MEINYEIIDEILRKVDEASPFGIKDENQLSIEGAEISKEEKRAYLDWLKEEGYIRFSVFGESRDNPKGIAKNIVITEKGINRLHGGR